MTENAGRAAGRIVVGIDGTAASLLAVRWAAQEALLRRASLHLVLVSRRYPRAPYSGLPEAVPAEGAGPDPAAQLAAAECEAGRALPPDRLESELVTGSPDEVLIDRSVGAELLVLGTAYTAAHSAGEIPPTVGSTTRACLHAAACPVVVVSTSMAPARRRL
jgi:nucleotide-binding universal stress UspA family protein